MPEERVTTGSEPTWEDLVTITMPRAKWTVIADAAESYDVRVPREQGDGGECLDVIRRAVEVVEPGHDEQTERLRRERDNWANHAAQEGLRAEVALDALRVIAGPADKEPLMDVYREAGGGYEGLQAVARHALAGGHDEQAELLEQMRGWYQPEEVVREMDYAVERVVGYVRSLGGQQYDPNEIADRIEQKFPTGDKAAPWQPDPRTVAAVVEWLEDFAENRRTSGEPLPRHFIPQVRVAAYRHRLSVIDAAKEPKGDKGP